MSGGMGTSTLDLDDHSPQTPPPLELDGDDGDDGDSSRPPVERERRSEGTVRTCVDAAVVVLCAAFVFVQLHPGEILSAAVPSGGDMGAHVWGPAYLRDTLLPDLRVTGWTPDWYAGFPAFQFYMVVPSLLIVALDVGVPGRLARLPSARDQRRLGGRGLAGRTGRPPLGAGRRGGAGRRARRRPRLRHRLQARDDPGTGHPACRRLRAGASGRPAVPWTRPSGRGHCAVPLQPRLHHLRRERGLDAGRRVRLLDQLVAGARLPRRGDPRAAHRAASRPGRRAARPHGAVPHHPGDLGAGGHRGPRPVPLAQVDVRVAGGCAACRRAAGVVVAPPVRVAAGLRQRHGLGEDPLSPARQRQRRGVRDSALVRRRDDLALPLAAHRSSARGRADRTVRRRHALGRGARHRRHRAVDRLPDPPRDGPVGGHRVHRRRFRAAPRGTALERACAALLLPLPLPARSHRRRRSGAHHRAARGA